MLPHPELLAQFHEGEVLVDQADRGAVHVPERPLPAEGQRPPADSRGNRDAVEMPVRLELVDRPGQ